MFPINLFRPWDINLRPPYWHGTKIQVTGWFEQGLKVQGFNAEGEKVNPLQIFTPRQDALAMLQGFPASSPMSIFFNTVLDSPTDDGVRGNFNVTGHLNVQAGGLAFRYHMAHHFTLGLHVPFYSAKLNNVMFVDLTPTDTTNEIIRTNLTDVLLQRVHEFDSTLNLTGWHRLGLGDILFSVDWLRNFPQGKPILKDVQLNGRLNVSFPTGVKKDDDKIFFIPFGLDGSVGLIFGGGLDITWIDHIRGGIDAEFIYLFGNTRLRRIKVFPQQTDFLFLAKVNAHKDFGFTQRFNIYLEGYQIWRGLSVSATYQYWKHGDDRLALCTNQFSELVANTAESLQEWTMHNMIFNLSYDFQHDICDDSYIKPQLAAFYKLGFNGSRALLVNSIGGILTFNF